MQPPDNSKKISPSLIELLQTTELFSEIHSEIVEELLKNLKLIELSPGDILFNEGDPSDDFYILIEGNLIAILNYGGIKEKIIGHIEKGETVGEMGTFSKMPRTLTIKATTKSTLLVLTHTEFELFSRAHPQILINLINHLILRSQSTIKLISEKKLYKHIAIIRGNDEVSINQFLLKLQKSTSNQKLLFLESDAKSINLSHEISMAEKNGKQLVFQLTPENLNTLQAKINHVGSIYIIVKNNSQVKFLKFALEMARGNHNLITTDVCLVILHDDAIQFPEGTQKWLSQADFSMHHHIKITHALDYQRLIRFIIGKPICVVLGGGGAKGWADVGALKAILEANLPIDAIGGTSSGALVGACYANYLDYTKLLNNYIQLSESADKPFSFKNFTWPIISLLSSKRPTELLKKMMGDKQIEDLWIPFFSISTNLNTGKEAIHMNGLLWERLRASMALPGIIPPVVIEGQLYVDGGLMNNLPVDTMQILFGKEALIIAVSLSDLGEDKTRYNFPPVIPFHVGLLKKMGLGYQNYKFPPFFHTFLISLLVGASSKEKANQIKANVIISPDLSKYHTLKMNIHEYSEILDIGYQSAKLILSKEIHKFSI